MIIAAAPLAAQDSATGAIRGTVLDSTGSRIPKASIAIVSTATGRRYEPTSDSEGRFAIDLLPPGEYSARTVAQGMSPQVSPPLHVEVGGAVELEFHLSVASAQESITVSGAPAVVETKSSAVSTVLDERPLNDVPLNGRRFSDLALFFPGLTQDPRSLTSATNGDLSFGGIRGFQNSFWSTGSTSTTPSSPRPADATARPIRFPRRSYRSSASRPIPTARSRDALAAQSSTWSRNRDRITCTARHFISCAIVPSARPIPSSPSNSTTASNRLEARSAARSSATRFSSSPDSTSTSSTSPTSSSFLTAARGLFRRRARDLTRRGTIL